LEPLAVQAEEDARTTTSCGLANEVEHCPVDSLVFFGTSRDGDFASEESSVKMRPRRQLVTFGLQVANDLGRQLHFAIEV
jgi:hypothetical protein